MATGPEKFRQSTGRGSSTQPSFAGKGNAAGSGGEVDRTTYARPTSTTDLQDPTRRGGVNSSGSGSHKRWLTRAEAGEYLGVHPRTLANWAARGQGPRYSKPSGNSCMYRLTDLDAYLEACMVHTEEQPEAA
ncbi:helix-turn-helix transcriptional regulator [Nocardia barduliensis]|uniref:helix-turn-helix transcriptional regulator n=1 Tax=Nocardia barduliensis TaxID=2736643 RepID=UPI0015735D8C